MKNEEKKRREEEVSVSLTTKLAPSAPVSRILSLFSLPSSLFLTLHPPLLSFSLAMSSPAPLSSSLVIDTTNLPPSPGSPDYSPTIPVITPVQAAREECTRLFERVGGTIRVVADMDLLDSSQPKSTPMDPVNINTIGLGGTVCFMSPAESFLTQMRGYKDKLIKIRCKAEHMTWTYIYKVGDVCEIAKTIWKVTFFDAECFVAGSNWDSYTIETPLQRLGFTSGAVGVDPPAWDPRKKTDASVPASQVVELKDQISAVYNLVLALMDVPEGPGIVSATPRLARKSWKRPREEECKEGGLDE